MAKEFIGKYKDLFNENEPKINKNLTKNKIILPKVNTNLDQIWRNIEIKTETENNSFLIFLSESVSCSGLKLSNSSFTLILSLSLSLLFSFEVEKFL